MPCTTAAYVEPLLATANRHSSCWYYMTLKQLTDAASPYYAHPFHCLPFANYIPPACGDVQHTLLVTPVHLMSAVSETQLKTATVSFASLPNNTWGVECANHINWEGYLYAAL